MLSITQTKKALLSEIEISNVTTAESFLIFDGVTQLEMSQTTVKQVVQSDKKMNSIIELLNFRVEDIGSLKLLSVFENILFENSQMPFLIVQNLKTSDIEKSYPNDFIQVNLTNTSIKNVAIKDQMSLIQFQNIDSRMLSVSVQNFTLEGNNFVESRAALSFMGNHKNFQIRDSIMKGNQGRILSLVPPNNADFNKMLEIEISNTSIENNLGTYDALIFTESNSQITLVNCTLQNNYYPLSRGSISLSMGTNSSIYIMNSTINNNTSLEGGVVYTQEDGHAHITDSIIQNNSAIRGGVTYNQNEGQITIANSILIGNTAEEASLFYLINSQNLVTVTNSTIKDNYLSANNYLDSSNFNILAIKGTLSLLNVTISKMEKLMKLEASSEVSLLNVTITDIISKVDQPFIDLAQSNLAIKMAIIQKVQLKSFLVLCDSESIFNLENANITQINSPLLNVHLSDTILQNINIYDSALSDPYFSEYILAEKSSIAIIDSTFRNSSIINGQGRIVYAFESNLNIHNTYFYFLKTRCIQTLLSEVQIYGSSFNKIENVKLDGLAVFSDQSSFKIENTTSNDISGKSGSSLTFLNTRAYNPSFTVELNSSTFTNNIAAFDGGAIQVYNINFKVYESTFVNNSARQKGGSIILSSRQQTDSISTSFEISLSRFIGNSAMQRGGAIDYSDTRPNGLKSLYFESNLAPYGKDWSSYPTQIIVNQQSLDILKNFSSGDSILQGLEAGLYDQDDQLVSLDQISQATIRSEDLKISITGSLRSEVKQGVLRFQPLTIKGQPNYNSTLLIEFQSIRLEVPISFRDCVEGEIVIESQCSPCPRDTYSFNKTDQKCSRCPKNGVCQGGNKIQVGNGYWRSSKNSLKIYECISKEACLQDSILNSFRGGETEMCKEGYSGKLCGVCHSTEETIYSKSDHGRCSICKPLGIQVLMVLIIAGIVLGYSSLLLMQILYYCQIAYRVIIRKPKRNKPQTTLLRILTGYFQVMMICQSFSLKWPSEVLDALSYFSFLSSSQESILSLECLLLQGGIQREFSVFIKILLFGLLPFIFAFLCSVVWIIKETISSRIRRDLTSERLTWASLKIRIQIIMFIVSQLLFPTVLSNMFSLFQCFSYEDGNSYLLLNMDIQCWGSYHRRLALLVGIPLISFWCVFYPAFIFIRLRKSQASFTEEGFLVRYGIFYVGLDDHAFYWEIIIVTLKKLIFICIATFVPQDYAIIKAILGLFPLLIQSQLTNFIKPYIDPRFNRLDFHATYAAAATLYGGIFFTSDQIPLSTPLVYILFTLILGYNCVFLLLWLSNMILLTLRIYSKQLNFLASKIYSFKNTETLIEDYESNLKKQLTTMSRNDSNQQSMRNKLTNQQNDSLLKSLTSQVNNSVQSPLKHQDVYLQNFGQRANETCSPSNSPHELQLKFSMSNPQGGTFSQAKISLSPIHLELVKQSKSSAKRQKTTQFTTKRSQFYRQKSNLTAKVKDQNLEGTHSRLLFDRSDKDVEVREEQKEIISDFQDQVKKVRKQYDSHLSSPKSKKVAQVSTARFKQESSKNQLCLSEQQAREGKQQKLAEQITQIVLEKFQSQGFIQGEGLDHNQLEGIKILNTVSNVRQTKQKLIRAKKRKGRSPAKKQKEKKGKSEIKNGGSSSVNQQLAGIFETEFQEKTIESSNQGQSFIQKIFSKHLEFKIERQRDESQKGQRKKKQRIFQEKM